MTDSTGTGENEVSIRAVRLSKWYGRIAALQDVSLHLGPGVWGLLGPNGSGKTTFLQLAAGQLRPALGEILVCGERPFGNPKALRRIGLCPEADALYDELTGLEFVSLMAELSGFPKKEAIERAASSLDAFGLADAKDRRIGGYSRGMRQRAKLAQCVVHDPDVILLDEPLTGTDPASRHRILEEVKRRAEAGAVVLFSTHVLPEIEALTDRVLLIARGQLAEQRRGHRRHAAGLRAACLGAFHQRDAFLEHGDGRVLEARIGHPRSLAREPVGDGLRVVIGIARGEEQRFAGLAMLAAPGAAAHRLRRGAPFGGDRTVHAGGLLHDRGV